MRFFHKREFFIPNGATKVSDKLSDAIAYLYTSKSGRIGAMVFFGKQNKPFIHYTYKTEQRREQSIKDAFEARRSHMVRVQSNRAERVAYVHDYKVGDILNTCWGYDQTNREFYEVTEVKGKFVTLREIACESVQTGWAHQNIVPMAGHYIGEPMRRLAQKGSIKIDANGVRWAHKTGFSEPVPGVRVYTPQSVSQTH